MEEQTNNLKNIHVIVTGAGRGLGAALSLGLSDLGCNLILCGRSPSTFDETAVHIETRTGRRPPGFVVDLANAQSVEAATKEILTAFHSVDVLINNGAGWDSATHPMKPRRS